MGETLQELFQIVVNQDMEQLVYPVKTTKSADLLIQGPDFNGKPKKQNWIIDGHADGAKLGSLYRISFYWGFSWEHGEFRSIEWELIEPQSIEEEEDYSVLALPGIRHTYSVSGSMNAFDMQDMVYSDKEDGVYETRFRIGAT